MPKWVRKWYDCEDCGTRVAKEFRYDRPNLCTDCGVRHAVDAAYALHEGGGGAYDRWAKSNGPAGRPPGRKNVGK